MKFAVEASSDRPVLVDKFLEDATEVDVDCIAGRRVAERRDDCHRRDAGAYRVRGRSLRRRRDGAAPHTLSQKSSRHPRPYTHAMAKELKVVGLMNVQYAVKGDTVYVLEVNPRASRTVPFVSKAIGKPLAKIARESHGRQDAQGTPVHRGNLDQVLGGEGIRVPVQQVHRRTFCCRRRCGPPAKSWARRRSRHGTPNRRWRRTRRCRSAARFSSASGRHAKDVATVAKDYVALGFELIATRHTAAILEKAG